MRPFDAVVVGGGVIGAATVRALARRGVTRTLLVEAGAVASGSTGYSGAMVRVYHSSPGLSDRALASFASHHITRTGSLYFDRTARRAAVEREVARLAAAGARLELLDAAAGARMFPELAWEPDDLAVHEPDAGHADPVATTRSWLAEAVAAGATVRERAAVERVATDDAGATGVRVDGAHVPARAVILAGGTGTAALLEVLGLPTGLTARTIEAHELAPRRPPALPCLFDVTTATFARPAGATVWAGGAFAARIPALADAPVVRTIRIPEAYAAERTGRVEAVPGVPRLFVAAGFSGTGFKCAPAIGAEVARLCAARF